MKPKLNMTEMRNYTIPVILVKTCQSKETNQTCKLEGMY